jgi:hypothetical protein
VAEEKRFLAGEGEDRRVAQNVDQGKEQVLEIRAARKQGGEPCQGRPCAVEDGRGDEVDRRLDPDRRRTAP